VAVGGMASVAAALGVAACGVPGPSGLPGSSSSASPRVAGALTTESTAPAPPLRVRAKPRATDPSQEEKTPPSPAWLVASAEAAQGWIAATNAFANASYTDDWNSPALVATEAAPELSEQQATLRSLSRLGIVGRGSPKILSVQVTSMSASFAQVLGCIGGDQIDIYLATGRPVPGKATSSSPRGVSADLVLTPSGWKVQKESVEVGQCSPG
jgi:hypothetical protein